MPFLSVLISAPFSPLLWFSLTVSITFNNFLCLYSSVVKSRVFSFTLCLCLSLCLYSFYASISIALSQYQFAFFPLYPCYSRYFYSHTCIHTPTPTHVHTHSSSLFLFKLLRSHCLFSNARMHFRHEKSPKHKSNFVRPNIEFQNLCVSLQYIETKKAMFKRISYIQPSCQWFRSKECYVCSLGSLGPRRFLKRYIAIKGNVNLRPLIGFH